MLDRTWICTYDSHIRSDIILFDLEPGKELLVCVEVVASDGPISEARKRSLTNLAATAGIEPSQIVFVTAYQDRDSPAFKKTFGALAWNTFVWLATEPDVIILLRKRPLLTSGRIFDFLD